MAETLLSFRVEKLRDLLVRESERFQGFDQLIADLFILRNLLKDADAKKDTHAIVRNIVKDTEEIVYDGEDIIETFLLKQELGKASGIRNMVRRFSKLMGPTFEIEDISKHISKVNRLLKDYGLSQMNDKYTQSPQERQRDIRQTFSKDNESVLVGLEENVKKLVSHLVEEESSQVVSITGMGGIGKTTLVKQVFNHEIVKSHFAGLVWVCVSQQFTRKHVWQSILRQLRPEYEVSDMSEDELQEKLFQVLETQKALIVLDDIWKEEDWDIIKPIFPLSGKGWKVLLTSRNEGVALQGDPKGLIFKQDFLNLDESWTLFRRIVFPGENIIEYKVDEKMEVMGKHMIKNCGGLPLAVKVLGGLLAGKRTLSEWERVHENIGRHIVGDRNTISYPVLELSFEVLPPYLKLCFLYLAHLPANFAIDVEDLSYYWAAERILSYDGDGATIQEIADGYIEELVKRNMVIYERDDKTSGYRRCRLHNLVREVCHSKAKEENFLQIVDANTATSTENSQFQCKSRRVVIHSSSHTFDVEKYTQNPRLRSLLFIKHNWGANWMVLDVFFKRLQLMRVLDLSGAEFEGDKLSSDIGKLIHLRYLSLYMAKVSHLPSSMQNLKKLLYLNLCVGAISPIRMPNFLKEMRELIYLFLPDDMQDKKNLELGNLINLETLENFSTKHSNVTDLHCMTRLKTVSIIFNGEGCTMETLSSTLGELKHLEKLTIGNKRVVGVRVKGKVLPVNKAGSAKKFFCGKKMVCSRGGFPQLKKLYLNGLAKWEKWIIEEGSMPLLQTLSISECRRLKEVPDGLKFITSLEELTIIKLGKEFKEKLSRGGKDYYKVQHIPHLIIPEYDMNFSDEECDNTEFRVYHL